MVDYLKQIGNAVYKLAIVLLLFTLCRVFFFVFNYALFPGNSTLEIIKIFIAGIRFDFSAIVYINLLLVLLYILPFRFTVNKRYIKILNTVFIVVNAFLLLLNFVDIEYFKFTGKRSTADLFGYIFLSDDVSNLLPQFFQDFWYIPLLWSACVVLGILLLRRIPFPGLFPKPNPWKVILYQWMVCILTCGALFTGARGVNLKPVRIITAAKYTSSQNLPLLLNTPFCILQTISEKDIASTAYFTPEELNKIYTPVQQLNPAKERIDNVVIIILESFSHDFIGCLTGTKGYTPILDSIAARGLLFENAFANGKRSIDAVPAILTSIPGLTDNAYIGSRYSGNAMDALPSILSRNGYNTSFFHGGRNGTMGFDEYASIAGIKHYYGMNEYKGPEAYDGHWGIFDEEFFHFFAQTLNTFQQPFFSTIFTLSSHHPYSVPDKYTTLFPKTENDLYRTMRYADYALGQFFKEAGTMPWFKNTLFVLVADHTARDESNAKDISLSSFRIPIVFYHPGDTTLHGKSTRITQQTDIMPSVLEYLGYSKPFVSFGGSVFSGTNPYAVYYLSGIYKFIQAGYLLTFDGEKSLSLYPIHSGCKESNDVLSKQPEIALSMEKKLKAIIQQYYTRLKNNTLVVK
jgi:phosphoglycerol transferase MdoB-like AlkP superfamily enzyme